MRNLKVLKSENSQVFNDLRVFVKTNSVCNQRISSLINSKAKFALANEQYL